MADDLMDLDLATVRARRDAVRGEEAAVSYRRRLLQAQLDIVAGLGDDAAVSLEQRLAALLADQPTAGSATRAVGTTVEHLDAPEPLPDDLASMAPEDRDALAERLATEERELSERRRALLDQLDVLQEELVRRYRDGGVDATALLGGDR